jgi:hypothetical protein
VLGDNLLRHGQNAERGIDLEEGSRQAKKPKSRAEAEGGRDRETGRWVWTSLRGDMSGRRVRKVGGDLRRQRCRRQRGDMSGRRHNLNLQPEIHQIQSRRGIPACSSDFSIGLEIESER